MLRAIRTILVCTVYGAVGTALVRFLYVSYTMIAGGVRRDDVPLETLLLEHVQALEFAIVGAAGGLAFGLLVVLVRLATWLRWRLARPREADLPHSDPDAIIRADRARRADSYLARRAAADD
jgi:hypothetical protein